MATKTKSAKTTKTNPAQAQPAPPGASACPTRPARQISEPGVPASASQREVEGRVQRERYLMFKKRISECEPENYTKLYFIRQKSHWFRGFGHTAIIFHYDIAPRINMNVAIMPDKDYSFQIEGGLVNIRNIDKLEDRLKLIKIYRLKGDENFRIFRLNKRYTPAEIAMMEQTKHREWSKVNHVIRPKEMYPRLFAAERELLNRAYFKVRLLDEQMRRLFGDDILYKVGEMLREYSLMSKGKGMSGLEYFDYVEQTAEWIEAQMTMLAELQVMTPEKIYQVLYATETVKREVETCRRGK